MKDLTHGSIAGHLIAMAVPFSATRIFQTLYYFVDLYFVAKLGSASVAGVSVAGNAVVVVVALTQVLGVGTGVLISHAVGRKDAVGANQIFNQAMLLAALVGLVVVAAGYFRAEPYLRVIAANEAVVSEGRQYLFWYMPGFGLQFVLVVMSAALRGTGVARPIMVIQISTVLLNALLAPLLIKGSGIVRPLGVAGAALASTIAIAVSISASSSEAGKISAKIWSARAEEQKLPFTIGDETRSMPAFIWPRATIRELLSGGAELGGVEPPALFCAQPVNVGRAIGAN